ncbi:MAG TPA: L,D-transpeptidase [Rhizomicrobium sp.]|nr:L,D-transpeptidase [Rhizomicrobium sp.]
MRLAIAASAVLFVSVAISAHSAEHPKTKPVPAAPNQNTQSITDPKAIENAQPPNGSAPSREVLTRVEVLLDRAHFSPGEIDGMDGENVKKAVGAFKRVHNLPNPDAIDGSLLKALTGADHGPVLQKYTISAEDEKGPFIGTVPKDFVALAKLKHVGYANPEEGLAEKFHMSPGLLRELNPNADFSKAGTTLTVAKPNDGSLPGTVDHVQVDKTLGQIRAYDASGKVLAVYPATVGSTDRPAPSGKATVVSVAPDPTYTYDPKRVTFGPKSAGVLKIAPGPNNPVGPTWIALSVATYGIHGTPDPDIVSKTASHGCIRLTNWDAAALGKAVKKGTAVEFMGEEQPKPSHK